MPHMASPQPWDYIVDITPTYLGHVWDLTKCSTAGISHHWVFEDSGWALTRNGAKRAANRARRRSERRDQRLNNTLSVRLP